jgi:penicillin-binding protein 1A
VLAVLSGCAGAQPVRPVDLAAFYAAIANEGLRPSPYVIESIERDGQNIFRRERNLVAINSVDRAAFYQLKSLLQGVLARGTARSIAALSPYVAGKTGTTDDENDAWFVGFTNDVTVAVWLGYDNADGQRRTLGSGSTGGAVAVPIFEPIWAHVASKDALAPPSPEASQRLSCKSSTDVGSEGRRRRGGEAIGESFLVDERGRVVDTRYRLVSRESDRRSHAELAVREQGEATEKSEPASAFESQRRGYWSISPRQTAPERGPISDNGGRGPAPRNPQGPGNDFFYYWFRD